MFVLLSQLLRFLLVVLILRIAFRGLVQMFRGRVASPSAPGPSARAQARLGGDLVKDSFCNTYVPRERALRAVVRGQEEYFCSAECRGRALAAAQAS